ncbi:hypothetical protein CEXT_734551 [Caerostris extrusa]|uniref:Uncharacterized protein n=1 Tax=Caerostris extrusa TaxID=172846 RepID=A0AAV4PYQ0_CAEEX|nr:hypothetical protein CEXT_734551 [Caerostris extrusa]
MFSRYVTNCTRAASSMVVELVSHHHLDSQVNGYSFASIWMVKLPKLRFVLSLDDSFKGNKFFLVVFLFKDDESSFPVVLIRFFLE